MIPNISDKEFLSGGVIESSTYGISRLNEASILSILRDTLYTDKILAVLREYGANAWDSHRMCGKADLPVKITLPTTMEPTLSIRDYGDGMDQETVLQRYTQYGDSSKRTTNLAVGTLGIGCKCGFAYADSFTVTSWHNGMKKIYAAVLDKTDKGIMSLLHYEECGEETGIEINIAVKPDDIPDFESRAKNLFQYFSPRPVINLELPEPPAKQRVLKNGKLFANYDIEYGRRGWTAVMGCIPYRVDISQLRHGESKQLPVQVERVSGVLNFDIGEVQVNASREELKYTDNTKLALIAKIEALIDEFVQTTMADIKDSSTSPWDRRIRTRSFHYMGILPTDMANSGLGDSSVILKGHPDTFHFRNPRSKHAPSSLSIDAQVRIVLKDDNRTVQGYKYNGHEYIVYKSVKATWAKVKIDLDAFLATIGITGVPIINISTLTWTNPHTGHGARTETPHYKYKVFLLTSPASNGPSSTKWTAVENRTPTTDDLYVILDRFETSDNFYWQYSRDTEMFKEYKVTVPPVYGYRNTEKSPVKKEDLVGSTYKEWREKEVQKLIAANKDALEAIVWAEQFYNKVDKKQYDNLVHRLGSNHPVATAVAKHMEACRGRKGSTRSKEIEAAYALYNAIDYDDKHAEATKTMDDLKARYPLLANQGGGIEVLVQNRSATLAPWFEYVNLIDAVKPFPQPKDDRQCLLPFLSI